MQKEKNNKDFTIRFILNTFIGFTLCTQASMKDCLGAFITENECPFNIPIGI